MRNVYGIGNQVQIWVALICIFFRANALGKYMNLSVSSPQVYVSNRTDWVLSLHKATSLGEKKFWIQTSRTPLKILTIYHILLVVEKLENIYMCVEGMIRACSIYIVQARIAYTFMCIRGDTCFVYRASGMIGVWTQLKLEYRKKRFNEGRVRSLWRLA